MTMDFTEYLENLERVALEKDDKTLFQIVIFSRRLHTLLLMEEIGMYQKRIEFLKKINEETTHDALESRVIIAKLRRENKHAAATAETTGRMENE